MARGGKGRTAPEPPSQEAEARASEGPSPQVNNLFEQERGGVDAEEDAPVAGPLGREVAGGGKGEEEEGSVEESKERDSIDPEEAEAEARRQRKASITSHLQTEIGSLGHNFPKQVLHNLEESLIVIGGDDPSMTMIDSVISMIFGSNVGEQKKAALMDKLEDYAAEVPIHPNQRLRILWDKCVMVGIAYHAMYWPAWMGFNYEGEVEWMYLLDKFANVFFLIDVLINFYTGFDDGGTIEMRKREVVPHYLRGYFVVDLYGALPIDVLMYAIPALSVHKRSGLLFRYEGLVRIACLLDRLFRYLMRLQERLNVDFGAIRVFKLTFLIVLFSHANACVQFLAVRVDDFPENSWVVRNGLVDSGPFKQYTYALFNALSHMLCIGYGTHGNLMAPTSAIEVSITILSMLSGASFYVVLVGIIASIILAMDHSGSVYKMKLDVWKQYFHYRGLPNDLRRRVMSYYSMRWHTKKYFEEAQLLAQIPPCLRADIRLFVCKTLLETVPIFHVCSDEVITTVICNLKENCCPGSEWIYKSDQHADEMFFIILGSVDIVAKDGSVLTTLGSGSYFGEFPLIFDHVKTRTAGARATEFTRMYTLSKTDFDRVPAVYPALRTIMVQIADARFKRTQSTAVNRPGGA